MRYTVVTSRPPKGLTLVELLVVLVIVAVVAAMLLLAIQAARKAARRLQCANNVKQIGLALQAHHDVLNRLPPGWNAYPPNGEPGWGWASMLLPFTEQENLLRGSGVGAYSGGPGETFRRGGPGGRGGPPRFQIEHRSNRDLRESALATFLCPSDPTETLFTLYRGGPGGGGSGSPSMFDVARANYVGVFGSAIESAPDDGNGCFFQSRSLKFRDITDGLSNTLMVGEHGSRVWPATWVGAVPGASRNMVLVVGSANRVPNSVPNYPEGFGSSHPGGANFVFCDGSVKPISDEVDLIAFQAQATCAGGE